MQHRVFVTGGSGFVGRRLVPALAAAGFRVVALDRSGKIAPSAPNIAVVKGDLLDPDSYCEALAGSDVVVHLAATTGRASAADHFRVNAGGTDALLKVSKALGVPRFLFVSSIAVTFPNQHGYHYALAKAQAEQAVRDSGLRFLIVRPTMILGRGSPLLSALQKLATLPVAVLPGRGSARVQPVHVDDVVVAILAAIQADAFAGEVVEVGGPTIVPVEDLLRRIRAARLGTPGPMVRLPLWSLQVPLRFAEALGLVRFLPITAGQLSSFRFDGVARPGRLVLPTAAQPKDLDSMVDQGMPAGESRNALDAECDVFTRHLLGRQANDYVRAKYRAAHAGIPLLTARGAFDAFLVRFARRGRFRARLADAHAAVFLPASTLRRKLIALLAILEASPPYHHLIDQPVGGDPFRAMIRLVPAALVVIVSLLAGSLILLPVHAVLAVSGGARDS